MGLESEILSQNGGWNAMGGNKPNRNSKSFKSGSYNVGVHLDGWKAYDSH